MSYRYIDMEHFARLDHFDLYRGSGYPYFGVTVDTDVTELVRFCRERRYSFYTVFIHAVALSADGVPELRRRIRGDRIVEYDACSTSHVELMENEAYCYCTLKHHMPLEEYVRYASEERLRSRSGGSIEEDADVEGQYFISSLPWLHYSSLTPALEPGDLSNPRITWGKYAADHSGRLMMPVTVFVHHALADGLHVARFYENLNRRIENIAAEKDEY